MDEKDLWDKIDKLLLSDDQTGKENKKIQEPRKENKKIQDQINIYITRRGTYIKIDSVDDIIINKVKNYFTIKNSNIMGYINKTHNFTINGPRLFIPRFGSFILKNKFSNISFINKIVPQNSIKLKYNGAFAGNQKIIFDEILNNYFNKEKTEIGRSGLILNLQAGMGKTFLAMALINHLQCRTLIVVHNRGMLQQWDKILDEYFPGTKIGYYYGGNKSSGDITIGIINSLVMKETPIKLFSGVDFVIFDEAHEYCSRTRSKIYDRCQAPYMLGLSATPTDREDGLDKINIWGIGPILVASKLEGYTEQNIPFKGNVVQVRYMGPDKYTKLLTNEKLELMSVPLMIGQLTEDKFRLKMIADLVMELHEKKHNIYVFADRREYLSRIEEEINKLSLKSYYLTNDEEAKKLESIKLVGGSSAEDMEDAKKTKTIILATYQYMATGTSIPKMNAIVLTTPRKSKSRQIIGRVFRFGSDYSIVRQIIDIVDWKTGLKNQWYKRKKYYEEQNYPIEVRNISYLDIVL